MLGGGGVVEGTGGRKVTPKSSKHTNISILNKFC